MELLGKSYAEHRGYEVKSSRAFMIFYYGECSLKEPFALTRDDLDKHFGYPVVDYIEEKNEVFRNELDKLIRA